jgi:hypothetical protein
MSRINNALSSSSGHNITSIKEQFRSQQNILQIDSEKVDQAFVFLEVDTEEAVLFLTFFHPFNMI